MPDELDELVVAVLAAGASRRLGRPKQLVEVAGEPVVRRQCRTAIAAAIGPVAVVLGCHRERIEPVISDLPVEILMNNDWAEGMASSVRTATRFAQARKATAILLLHADQYAVTHTDLERLRDAWRASPRCACLARDGHHLGPPAILPAALFESLLALRGDTGPRVILSGEPRVTEIAVPNASSDIDRPSDLALVDRTHP